MKHRTHIDMSLGDAIDRISILFLGSALVNRRDAEAKGRQTIKGIKNPKAKLTERQVAEIRDFLDDHVLNKSQIARNYGVSKSTISRISLGKLWRNRQ